LTLTLRRGSREVIDALLELGRRRMTLDDRA